MLLFVWYEGACTIPTMPLGLFGSPVFSGANVMTLPHYFALGGVLFFLPFNLIRIQGYSATLAGGIFLEVAGSPLMMFRQRSFLSCNGNRTRKAWWQASEQIRGRQRFIPKQQL